MAKIVDIDLLNNGQAGTDEIWFDTTALTVTLNPSGTNFDGDNDGVAMQCIYSFAKRLWKDDPN